MELNQNAKAAKLKAEQRFQALFRGADFAGHSPRFFFERADGEGGAVETLTKILLYKWLEPATAFTLRDMNELMHEQFAVAPAIGANHDAVTNTGAA